MYDLVWVLETCVPGKIDLKKGRGGPVGSRVIKDE